MMHYVWLYVALSCAFTAGWCLGAAMAKAPRQPDDF